MEQNKLRVLYLITDLGKGGAERSITDLCMAFKSRNDIECKIGILFSRNEFQKTTEKLKNVVFLDYKIGSIFQPSYTPLYHKLVEEFNPHIIHSNRFLAEFLTQEKIYDDVLYVCHGRDSMIQLRNFTAGTLFKKRLITNFYEKQLLVWKKYKKIKTYFIANSKDTFKYFENVLPKESVNNIELIYNGVNLSRFYNAAKKTITNKKLRLVNVGSFQEKKNQQFLVDIGLKLSKKDIDYEFHCLGDGETRLDVEKKVRDNNLTERFFFHGNVNDVENWLKSCDFYVHSAFYEPFGIVFLEAMATGLPIITLDGKGNRDLIINDFNGYIFNVADPNLFAETIIELSENPETYSRISENAKEYSRKFDIKIKTQEYLEFYTRILPEAGQVPKA